MATSTAYSSPQLILVARGPNPNQAGHYDLRMSLRVALVGCGRWGRHILRDLVNLGCEAVVVARSEASVRTAIELGASKVVGSVADLPDVAGAVVATPTTTHAAVTGELLELGVPVYVEKPLTDDPRSAAALAARAPDRLFVMHKWRYHPGVQALASIARDQELGPLSGVRTTRVGWGNPHGDVDGVWMLAPHDISILLEILSHIPQPRAAVVETMDSLATGLVGLLGEDPWGAIDISIAHSQRRREVRLICQGGVAVLPDAYSDHIVISRGNLMGHDIDPEIERRSVSTELPLLRELRAFVEHVEGGEPPKSGADDAAAEVAAIGRLRELAGVSPRRPAREAQVQEAVSDSPGQ
jgi:predicted dehydrogenase